VSLIYQNNDRSVFYPQIRPVGEHFVRLNMKTGNLFHKLHESVRYLATGKGTLKERLMEVFVSYLISLHVDPCGSDAETLVCEAIRLATKDKDKSGRLGDLYVTICQNHWTADREIARKIFRAYEIVSESYHRRKSEK
jgi:hypothetical protein